MMSSLLISTQSKAAFENIDSATRGSFVAIVLRDNILHIVKRKIDTVDRATQISATC